MRILVVDDSAPHRKLLTLILARGGHQVLTAPDGQAALDMLGRGEEVDGVVSDVKMPNLDGFQLCRALRRDHRWSRLPFIFYSSIFIGKPARELGRDLGATAYLDAKDVEPAQMARELEELVNRHIRKEYDETLGRILDDVEFARRYHQVVLSSLSQGAEDVRELVAASAAALDEVIARLDAERRALTADAERSVHAEKLKLLRELGDYLGDRINNPLAVILGMADLLPLRIPGDATSDAAAKIRTAVQRITSVVREIAEKGEQGGQIPPPGPPRTSAVKRDPKTPG